MKILRRYVLTELTGPFLVGIVSFTFLLMVAQIFRIARLLINQEVPGLLVLKTMALILPSVLTYTVPMALLLAVLLAFGRLAGDREIMAIRTSGVSLWMLFAPVIALGTLLTVVMLPLVLNVFPRNVSRLAQLKGEVAYVLATSLEPNLWYNPESANPGEEVHLRYQERGAGHGEMKRLEMYTITGEPGDPAKRHEVLILAREAQLTPEADQSGISFTMHDGALHVFDQYSPAQYVLMRFDTLYKRIEIDLGEVKRTEARAEELDLAALGERIERLRPQLQGVTRSQARGGSQLRRLWERFHGDVVERWSRFSMPFACLTFVLIGIPLGIMGRTSARPVGFAVAFLLIFLYYILLKWGSSLGMDGHPLAPLAILSPNLVLATIGAIFLYKTIRE